MLNNNDKSDDWVQLRNGAYYSFDGRHDLRGFGVREIAETLACVNRFRGATKAPLSVAAHCAMVADIVFVRTRNLDTSIKALFHDVGEVVIGDIPRPVKHKLSKFDSGFMKQLESDVVSAMFQHIGLDLPDQLDSTVIKNADNTALAIEKRDLMHTERRPWMPLPECPRGFYAESVDQVTAAAMFLRAFVRYSGLNRCRKLTTADIAYVERRYGNKLATVNEFAYREAVRHV